MVYFKQGNVLDVLARKALWDVGLDYMHGTGHGVGHYLNVHEGPMGIHMRPNPDDPVSVFLHSLNSNSNIENFFFISFRD